MRWAGRRTSVRSLQHTRSPALPARGRCHIMGSLPPQSPYSRQDQSNAYCTTEHRAVTRQLSSARRASQLAGPRISIERAIPARPTPAIAGPTKDISFATLVLARINVRTVVSAAPAPPAPHTPVAAPTTEPRTLAEVTAMGGAEMTSLSSRCGNTTYVRRRGEPSCPELREKGSAIREATHLVR